MITAVIIGLIAAGVALVVEEMLRRHRLQRTAAAEHEAAERAAAAQQEMAKMTPVTVHPWKELTIAEVETFSHIGLVRVAGSLVSSGITSGWPSYHESERRTLDAVLYLSFLDKTREQLLAIIRKYHESNPPIYCTQNLWRAEQHLRAAATE